LPQTINVSSSLRCLNRKKIHNRKLQRVCNPLEPGKILTKFQDPIIREEDMSSVTPWLAADEVSEEAIKFSLTHILTTIDHVHRLKAKAW